MTYVISDIHGCYDRYLQMLQTINFRAEDMLYVLGDAVDRGEKPIEVLRDMSMRANVIPIMGNHDWIALDLLKKTMLALTDENINEHFDGDLMEFYRQISFWQSIGGDPTLKSFGKLKKNEREDILDYLSEFSLYELITVNGENHLLTHWGIPEGATLDNLDDYTPVEFIEATANYESVRFEDTYLVSGHLPTFVIDEAHRGKILRKNRNIAIDTGAVFGEKMGCLCLDTGEEFYV